MQKILPASERRSAPAIPTIYGDETPENRFKLNIEITAEDDSRKIQTRLKSASALAGTIGASSQTKLIDRDSRSSTNLERTESKNEKSQFEISEKRRNLAIIRYKRDQERIDQ